MSKLRRYSPEYNRELAALVRQSQSSCRQIALQVGVDLNTLTRPVGGADPGGGTASPAAIGWPTSGASCRG